MAALNPLLLPDVDNLDISIHSFEKVVRVEGQPKRWTPVEHKLQVSAPVARRVADLWRRLPMLGEGHLGDIVFRPDIPAVLFFSSDASSRCAGLLAMPQHENLDRQ